MTRPTETALRERIESMWMDPAHAESSSIEYRLQVQAHNAAVARVLGLFDEAVLASTERAPETDAPPVGWRRADPESADDVASVLRGDGMYGRLALHGGFVIGHHTLLPIAAPAAAQSEFMHECRCEKCGSITAVGPFVRPAAAPICAPAAAPAGLSFRRALAHDISAQEKS